jgi:opacity protein-like surface antigen
MIELSNSRPVRITALTFLISTLVGAFGQAASAKTAACWKDPSSGELVPAAPDGGKPGKGLVRVACPLTSQSALNAFAQSPPGSFGGLQLGIGGNIGGAWSSTDYEDIPRFTGSGLVGGPSVVLRNYIQPNTFIGVDFGWMATDIKAKNDDGAFGEHHWQGWAGVQGGITLPGTAQPVTIYGGGGLAFGGVTVGIRDPFVQETMTKTLPGWTVDGGLEWRVAPQFNFGLEYRYSQLSGDIQDSRVTTGISTLSVTGRYVVGGGIPSLVRRDPMRAYDSWWWDGPYIGLEGVQTRGELGLREFSVLLDKVTFHSCDWFDPFGVGVVAGYAFSPWNNVRVSPFVSVDYPNQTLNHVFPGGSYLGTTSKFTGTAGVKAGPVVTISPSLPSFWLYGIAGASVLNEDVNVSFGGTLSGSNQNVAGTSLGAGLSFQPSMLQGMGRPVALFVEYQFTRWQSAHLDSPTASPFFNYTFRREDEAIKFGFNIALEAPGASPSSMLVKAPRRSN